MGWLPPYVQLTPITTQTCKLFPCCESFQGSLPRQLSKRQHSAVPYSHHTAPLHFPNLPSLPIRTTSSGDRAELSALPCQAQGGGGCQCSHFPGGALATAGTTGGATFVPSSKHVHVSPFSTFQWLPITLMLLAKLPCVTHEAHGRTKVGVDSPLRSHF